MGSCCLLSLHKQDDHTNGSSADARGVKCWSEIIVYFYLKQRQIVNLHCFDFEYLSFCFLFEGVHIMLNTATSEIVM